MGSRSPIVFAGNALQNLESLWLNGKEEFEAFQSGVRKGLTNNLKHLSVRLTPLRRAGFDTFHLPPRIESLTLHTNILPVALGASVHEPIDTYGLEALHNTSHLWSKDCRHFKALAIDYGGYSEQDTTDFDLLVVKIESVCELMGVTVVLRRLDKEQLVERMWVDIHSWPLGPFKEMDLIRSHY